MNRIIPNAMSLEQWTQGRIQAARVLSTQDPPSEELRLRFKFQWPSERQKNSHSLSSQILSPPSSAISSANDPFTLWVVPLPHIYRKWSLNPKYDLHSSQRGVYPWCESRPSILDLDEDVTIDIGSSSEPNDSPSLNSEELRCGMVSAQEKKKVKEEKKILTSLHSQDSASDPLLRDLRQKFISESKRMLRQSPAHFLVDYALMLSHSTTIAHLPAAAQSRFTFMTNCCLIKNIRNVQKISNTPSTGSQANPALLSLAKSPSLKLALAILSIHAADHTELLELLLDLFLNHMVLQELQFPQGLLPTSPIRIHMHRSKTQEHEEAKDKTKPLLAQLSGPPLTHQFLGQILVAPLRKKPPGVYLPKCSNRLTIRNIKKKLSGFSFRKNKNNQIQKWRRPKTGYKPSRIRRNDISRQQYVQWWKEGRRMKEIKDDKAFKMTPEGGLNIGSRLLCGRRRLRKSIPSRLLPPSASSIHCIFQYIDQMIGSSHDTYRGLLHRTVILEALDTSCGSHRPFAAPLDLIRVPFSTRNIKVPHGEGEGPNQLNFPFSTQDWTCQCRLCRILILTIDMILQSLKRDFDLEYQRKWKWFHLSNSQVSSPIQISGDINLDNDHIQNRNLEILSSTQMDEDDRDENGKEEDITKRKTKYESPVLTFLIEEASCFDLMSRLITDSQALERKPKMQQGLNRRHGIIRLKSSGHLSALKKIRMYAPKGGVDSDEVCLPKNAIYRFSLSCLLYWDPLLGPIATIEGGCYVGERAKKIVRNFHAFMINRWFRLKARETLPNDVIFNSLPGKAYVSLFSNMLFGSSIKGSSEGKRPYYIQQAVALLHIKILYRQTLLPFIRAYFIARACTVSGNEIVLFRRCVYRQIQIHALRALRRRLRAPCLEKLRYAVEPVPILKDLGARIILNMKRIFVTPGVYSLSPETLRSRYLHMKRTLQLIVESVPTNLQEPCFEIHPISGGGLTNYIQITHKVYRWLQCLSDPIETDGVKHETPQPDPNIQPLYIVKGDLSKCFDNICHRAMELRLRQTEETVIHNLMPTNLKKCLSSQYSQYDLENNVRPSQQSKRSDESICLPVNYTLMTLSHLPKNFHCRRVPTTFRGLRLARKPFHLDSAMIQRLAVYRNDERIAPRNIAEEYSIAIVTPGDISHSTSFSNSTDGPNSSQRPASSSSKDIAPLALPGTLTRMWEEFINTLGVKIPSDLLRYTTGKSALQHSSLPFERPQSSLIRLNKGSKSISISPNITNRKSSVPPMRLARGIPQGASPSSMLCDIFLGRPEVELIRRCHDELLFPVPLPLSNTSQESSLTCPKKRIASAFIPIPHSKRQMTKSQLQSTLSLCTINEEEEQIVTSTISVHDEKDLNHVMADDTERPKEREKEADKQTQDGIEMKDRSESSQRKYLMESGENGNIDETTVLLEEEHREENEDKDIVLYMRWVDDFIYITRDQKKAECFLQAVRKEGIGGIDVAPSKLETSFDYKSEEDGFEMKASTSIKWLEMLIEPNLVYDRESLRWTLPSRPLPFRVPIGYSAVAPSKSIRFLLRRPRPKKAKITPSKAMFASRMDRTSWFPYGGMIRGPSGRGPRFLDHLLFQMVCFFNQRAKCGYLVSPLVLCRSDVLKNIYTLVFQTMQRYISKIRYQMKYQTFDLTIPTLRQIRGHLRSLIRALLVKLESLERKNCKPLSTSCQFLDGDYYDWRRGAFTLEVLKATVNALAPHNDQWCRRLKLDVKTWRSRTVQALAHTRFRRFLIKSE